VRDDECRPRQISSSLAITNRELAETRIRLAQETEAERKRISRDLHDQTLADLRHLLVAIDQIPPAGPSPTSPSQLRNDVEMISNEIRHICEDLSPSVLANVGLLPALEWALSDCVSHLPQERKFDYEFIAEAGIEESLSLTPTEQIQIYRILQEAISNASRHAEAAHVRLSIKRRNKADSIIELEDDGKGFDSEIGSNKTGYGLANIRSRADIIGAQVSWVRRAPHGCVFTLLKANCVASSPE